jgi:hypothetical protein
VKVFLDQVRPTLSRQIHPPSLAARLCFGQLPLPLPLLTLFVDPPTPLLSSPPSVGAECPRLTRTPQLSIIFALTCRAPRLGVSSFALSSPPLTQHRTTSIWPCLGRNRLPDATRCRCCMFPGFMLVAELWPNMYGTLVPVEHPHPT